MPKKYKIFLSLMVFVVGLISAYFEVLYERIYLATLVFSLMCLMLIGLWILPEARGKKYKTK